MDRKRASSWRQLGWFQPTTTPLSFAQPRVVPLGEGSWVEHHPAWFHDHEALFEQLEQLSGWEQRQRWMFTKVVDEPRLTAEFPALAESPPSIVELGAVLSAHFRVIYDSVWLNLYRDERDSTGWHADRPSRRHEQCPVPVLSLGETRRFLVRAKSGGPSTSFVVEAGDLIVMGGYCQRDFVHCVPKETRRHGPRISLNFGSSIQADPGSGVAPAFL